MESLRNPIILGSVALYMAMCVGVGIWALRRTQSARDFFMAGRNLGMLVTGVALFSSMMSGFGFVGGPGLVYLMGMSSVWMIATVAIGWAITDFLVAKRLRIFAGVFDTISLPDAVAARYGSEMSRLLTSIALLLGVLGYLATQILAMAIVLQTILQNTFGEIGLVTCAAIACAVLVFYSVTGGIIASVYTDIVQGTVMVVAGVFIFFTAISVFEGGANTATTMVMNDDPEAIGPWGTLGMIGCLSWFFMFTVGNAGQPHIVTKGMMIRRIQDYQYIPLISVFGYTLTALLWVSIGLGDAGTGPPRNLPRAGHRRRRRAGVSPTLRPSDPCRLGLRRTLRRHHVDGGRLPQYRCRSSRPRHPASDPPSLPHERAILGSYGYGYHRDRRSTLRHVLLL